MMSVAAARFDPRVEAAALAHYGVDVRDMSVSWRRLLLLIRLMPARVWAEQSPDDQGWTADTYMLANLSDQLAGLSWLSEFNLTRKRPKQKPKPIERPGDRAKEPDGMAGWWALARAVKGGG